MNYYCIRLTFESLRTFLRCKARFSYSNLTEGMYVCMYVCERGWMKNRTRINVILLCTLILLLLYVMTRYGVMMSTAVPVLLVDLGKESRTNIGPW